MVHSHIKGHDGVLVGTIDNIEGGYRILRREPAKEYPGRVHDVEPRVCRALGDARRAVYNMFPGAVISDVRRDIHVARRPKKIKLYGRVD